MSVSASSAPIGHGSILRPSWTFRSAVGIVGTVRGGLLATGDAVARVGFRDVFVVAEFRGLFAAQVLSLLGDQLARVALAVLVFERTGSALLTGIVYALGYLPAVVGGALLGGLADRYPRRQLMVCCDLLRALLVAVMALVADNLVVLCVLLVAAELLSAPFAAARAALLVDVLSGERYLLASAVGNITGQSAQVVGFAVGGALIAMVGTGPTLMFNVVTFLASALLLMLTVHARPAHSRRAHSDPSGPGPLVVLRLLLSDPRLRVLIMLALLCGFYVIPEGLAAPYAALLGGGPAAVGLLMAAQPLGSAVGALLLVNLVTPARRAAAMPALAVLASGALVGCALQPGIVVVLGLLVLSGVGTAYQLTANAAFAVLVPAAVRGQAFGLV